MEMGNNFVFATMEQIDDKLSDLELSLFKIYEKAEPSRSCGAFSQFHKKQSNVKKFLVELEAVRFYMKQAENLKFVDNELFTESMKKSTYRILFHGNFCRLVSMTDSKGKTRSLLTVSSIEQIEM